MVHPMEQIRPTKLVRAKLWTGRQDPSDVWAFRRMQEEQPRKFTRRLIRTFVAHTARCSSLRVN